MSRLLTFHVLYAADGTCGCGGLRVVADCRNGYRSDFIDTALIHTAYQFGSLSVLLSVPFFIILCGKKDK